MHLIQQHTFDIQCTSQAFAQEVQSQLGSLLEQSFYPKLELVFQKYDLPTQYWSIDALDIEIDELSKRYWKEDLVEKMLQQIEDYLLKQQPKFLNLTENEALDANANLESTNTQLQLKKWLFAFLKEGSLPPNGLVNTIESLLGKLDYTQLLTEELIELFKSDFNTLVRWVFAIKNENFKNQYRIAKNEALVLEIKNLWIPMWINHMKRFPIDHKSILRSLESGNKTQWEALLFWSVVLFQEQNATPLFSQLNSVLQSFFSVSVKELVGSFRVFTSSVFGKPLLFSKGFSNASVQFIQTWETTFINKTMDSLEQDLPKMDYLDTQRKVEQSLKNNPSYFINNAGLVLLHPFLERLFAMNGWTKEGEWLDYVSIQKGILSLHYLVFGEQEIDENQLILNKIICGLEIHEVVDVTVELTRTEKEKCVNLLQAVLEHWHIIKSSSIEALQETFLQREGKIEWQLDEFELWIKDHGADILLEHLPWGISMFKTPWMRNYMNCHWSQ